MSLSPSLRRALPLAAALVCLPATCAHAQTAAALGGWNTAEQRTVVGAGLMGNGPDGRFDGQLALSGADMAGALQALTLRPGMSRVTAWNDRSVAGFDAAMVAVLGLGSTASHVEAVAAAASLSPPRYFGTEVVARLLGLRFDHPAGQDALELYPSDPITRAEAAHSLAKILLQGPWTAAAARTLLAGFSLPRYSAAQLVPLRVAASKIGFPYVWGGISDVAAGGQAHGGYDCSGLIWRAFKPSGAGGGARIAGRSAAQMARETPRSARLALSAVVGGDLLFFGAAGFGGSATEASITHSAIALSGQWAIESSSQGVNVAPLTSGWLRTSFAWGRRVLSGAATPAVAPASSAPRRTTRSRPLRSHSKVHAPVAPSRVGVTGGLSSGARAPSVAAGHTGGTAYAG
jgi:cell wall-associated NlpC family hydrolase